MNRVAVAALTAFAVSAVASVSRGVSGQQPAQSAGSDWRSYAGDLRNQHYSPLAQISGSNFNALEVAWRFKTDNLGPRPEFKLEGTPLMVNGVLYATAGTRRAVVALHPGTGELKWVHSIDEGARGEAAPRVLSGRGLAYWTDGKEERILYITIGFQLVALDAKTGTMVSNFGKAGRIDLKEPAIIGRGDPIDPVTGEIGINATPVVVGNVVIVGGTFSEQSGTLPTTHNNTKGLVQAYDARSGKRLWIFRTIPMPGEFGNDSWEENSWSFNGNNGVWTQISVDEALGMA